MTKWFIMICSLGIIPIQAYSQNWQSAFLLDSRTGYTSNMYLNPILSEWDRTEDTGYFLLSPMGNVSVSAERFYTDMTAGVVYETFLSDRDAWKGGFSIFNSRYRLNDRWRLGVDAGAGYYTTTVDRTTYWLYPVLSWSPGLFTIFHFRAGPSFRHVDSGLESEPNEFEQFNTYSADVEYWPTFSWQLKGTVFGNLKNPAENAGFRVSAGHRITRNWQLTLRSGLERYQYQVVTETGGGGGFPPTGGPGTGEQLIDEADRLFRTGVETNYQVSPGVTATMSAGYLNYYSTATGESLGDYQLSAGVRVSLFRSDSRSGADVDVRQNGNQTIVLDLNYSGDGELYMVGEFNDWQKPGVALSKQSRNRYVARISLDAGAYEYKILLIEGSEEKWIELSDDVYTVSDGFGGVNGLIFID